MPRPRRKLRSGIWEAARTSPLSPVGLGVAPCAISATVSQSQARLGVAPVSMSMSMSMSMPVARAGAGNGNADTGKYTYNTTHSTGTLKYIHMDLNMNTIHTTSQYSKPILSFLPEIRNRHTVVSEETASTVVVPEAKRPLYKFITVPCNGHSPTDTSPRSGAAVMKCKCNGINYGRGR